MTEGDNKTHKGDGSNDSTKYKKLKKDLLKIKKIRQYIETKDSIKNSLFDMDNIKDYDRISKEYIDNYSDANFENMKDKDILKEIQSEIKLVDEKKYKKMMDYHAEYNKGIIRNTDANYLEKIEKYQGEIDTLIENMTNNANGYLKKYQEIHEEKDKEKEAKNLLTKIKQTKNNIETIKKHAHDVYKTIEQNTKMNESVKNKIIGIYNDNINEKYDEFIKTFQSFGENDKKINLEDEIKNKISESYFTDTPHNQLVKLKNELDELSKKLDTELHYINIKQIYDRAMKIKDEAIKITTKNIIGNNKIMQIHKLINSILLYIKNKANQNIGKIEKDVFNTDNIKLYVNKLEKPSDNLEKPLDDISHISDVFEYILYKNNTDEINAITGTKDDKDNAKIKYTLTKISALDDVDKSIKDKISQTIIYEYKKTLQNNTPNKTTSDANPKEIQTSEEELKKVIESMKEKIKNIENKSESKISDVFQYILYKSNNKLKAITINDTKYKIMDINKSDDMDKSIKDGIPQTIKDVLKETTIGGSSKKKKINSRRAKKEKTSKSMTKRKKKWINRKSCKYIK